MSRDCKYQNTHCWRPDGRESWSLFVWSRDLTHRTSSAEEIGLTDALAREACSTHYSNRTKSQQ
jgi:hypothetical protein